MSVREKDQGAGKLLANLKALSKLTVRVGVLDEAPKKPGTAADGKAARGSRATLLGVAAAHEFGAPAAGIPQRSYIRATVDLKRAEIEKVQADLAAQVAAGKIDGRTALARLGAFVQGLIQQRIAEGIGPALKPATVRRKKSSKPLIDKGQLRSSITFKVTEAA